MRRVLLGSTAHRLAHHAHCPLLVLPRVDESEPDGTTRIAEAA